MSYLDRLRICTYTSPSGAQFTPHFDDTSRSASKKAPVTELPQLDIPDVQDLGQGAVRFSMRLYFDGPDYDITSDNFWGALTEKGLGTLSHPRWGDVTVIPLTVAQAEDMVSGARVAIFTVEFVSADSTISYPVSVKGEKAGIIATASSMELTVADNFYRDFIIVDSRDRASVLDDLRESVAIIAEGLEPIASIDTDIAEEFDEAKRSFLSRLDDTISDGAAIAAEIIRIARIPAKAVTAVRDKVRGYLTVYENLSRYLINPFEGLFLNIQWPSQAQSAAMVLTALGVGAAECVTTGGDTNRAKTIQNTIDLAVIRDGIEADISIMEDTLVAIDREFYHDDDTAQQLRQALTTAIALQVEAGFSRQVERIMILDHDVTPLDFVYSVYGSIDRLDEWIEQNELSGDEHFILRAGSEVRYYE